MMKISAKICLIAAIGMFVAIGNANSFFFLPPTPFSPTLDGCADAAGGVEAGGNVISSINEKAQRLQTQVLDKIKKFQEDIEGKIDSVKSKVDDIKGNVEDKIGQFKDKAKNWAGDKVQSIAGKLHKKEKGEPTVATSRDIAECEIADIRDEESIIAAFKVLFGQYPAEFLEKYPKDKEGIKKLYADKAIEFSNDAMVELYIASRDMDERMEALQQEVDGMSDKYVTGTAVEPNPEVSGETGEANDELGSWVNYYKVAEIYDSILRITEELSALEAQYEAAQALRGGIIPEEPEQEDEVSANEYFNIDIKAAVSYAQAKPNIFQKPVLNIKDENLDLIETQPRVAVSPFKGTAAQFKSLSEISRVDYVLKEAVEVHNMMQVLDNYKGPFVEYKRMKDLHQAVIDKVRHSEECVLNHLGRYYSDPVTAWLGKGCVHGSSSNIVCDSGIQITPEVLDTVTTGDYLCSYDKTKLCSDYSLNRYERRGGLSGWLITAYKIAKAEKTLEYGDVEFATKVNDVDVSDSSEVGSLEDMEQQGNVVTENENSGVPENNLLKPSDEVRINQNDRERDVLAWQIGSLVAQKIGKAMAEGDDTYGEFHNKYDLWYDEKYFYEKYLEGKYSNMEIFIRSLDMRNIALSIARSINDSLYVEEDEEEKEQEDYEGPKMHNVLFNDVVSYNALGLEGLKKAIEENPAPKIDDVKHAQAQYDATINAAKAKFVADVNKQEQNIADLYEQLDELSLELEEARVTYNEFVEAQREADSQIEAEKMSLEVAANRSEQSTNAKTDTVKAKAEANMVTFAKTKTEMELKAQEQKAIIAHLEEEIDNKMDQLEDAKEALVKIKKEYAGQMSKLEYGKEIVLSQAYSQIKSIEISTLSKHLNAATGTKSAIFKDVVKVADAVTEIVRDNALVAIREGYEEIKDLDIFNPENHQNIINIHKQIMDDIKNPAIVGSINLGRLSGYIQFNAIKSMAIQALANELYNNICGPDVDCNAPDEQYYIAAEPGAKDFTAPKAIAPTYTPPLREMVHFDGKDFDNLVLSEDYHLAKDGLITVGAMLSTSCDANAQPYFCENQDETTATVYKEFVPPIWKLILGGKGYVEKDVPLIPLLQGTTLTESTDTMISGGVLPCDYKEYSIHVNDGKYIVANKRNLPACTHIKSIKFKVLDNVTITTLDGIELEAKESMNYSASNAPKSELAIFAGVDANGWYFNDNLRKVMKYLSELGEDYDKTEKYKSDSMIFDRNQFGDLLKFVEGEMEYQKNLDQLDVKVDSTRESLNETFAKFGFVPEDPEYDLSEQEVSDGFIAELKTIKDNKVKEAEAMLANVQEMLKNVDDINSSMIYESLERIDNLLAMLKEDVGALVNISENMTLEELQEAIARADTDKATLGEYDERVESSYTDQEENYMSPYCAVY